MSKSYTRPITFKIMAEIVQLEDVAENIVKVKDIISNIRGTFAKLEHMDVDMLLIDDKCEDIIYRLEQLQLLASNELFDDHRQKPFK